MPASANTIIPGFVAFAPGSSLEYSAQLINGELHANDGFTIFDVYGYTGASAPAGWEAVTQSTGSLFGSPTLNSVDDPSLTNVNFRYLGTNGVYQQYIFGSPVIFTQFFVYTSAGNTTTDDWVSVDHLVGSTAIVGDGTPSAPSGGSLVVSAPDGGWTVAMLGSGLLAIGLLRRRLGMR
jgi:hypothetical protein